MEQDKYVTWAREALAASLNTDINRISLYSCSRIRLPSLPLPPGQAGTNPVHYRYFIALNIGTTLYQYQGEGGRVRFMSQTTQA